MHKNTTLLGALLLLMVLMYACKSAPVTPPADHVPTEQQVLQKLYDEYTSGEIQRCKYQGSTIYKCSRNAPDAGSEIFNEQGDKIGGCYYSTRQLHPACEGATDCKVIYRVAKNIWGKPGVDLEMLK